MRESENTLSPETGTYLMEPRSKLKHLLYVSMLNILMPLKSLATKQSPDWLKETESKPDCRSPTGNLRAMTCALA